jgi:predicted nucleic acid-binding protein
MKIVAAVIVTGTVLVTNDTRHFSKIKELKTENWC